MKLITLNIPLENNVEYDKRWRQAKAVDGVLWSTKMRLGQYRDEFIASSFKYEVVLLESNGVLSKTLVVQFYLEPLGNFADLAGLYQAIQDLCGDTTQDNIPYHVQMEQHSFGLVVPSRVYEGPARIFEGSVFHHLGAHQTYQTF